MTNEGIIESDSKIVVKSEMLKQLWALGPTDPDTWERAVFSVLSAKLRSGRLGPLGGPV